MTRAALAAVLLAGVPTAATADARLDAFRSVCIPTRENYEATWLKAKQDGWTEVDADEHDELEATVDLLREQNDPEGLAVLSPFRKEIAGRPLYVVAASFPQALSLVTSCLVFDFEADEAIDASLVSEWLNMVPAEVAGAPGEGSSETWRNVAEMPGSVIKNIFVPEGSPAVPYAGFSGVMLRIDSVGR